MVAVRKRLGAARASQGIAYSGSKSCNERSVRKAVSVSLSGARSGDGAELRSPCLRRSAL